MANQAIALQVRAPQMPDLARPTAQMAQMMNMLAQQRAAERQAAQAQQRIDLDAKLAQPQFEKATSEAQGELLKTALDFNSFVYTGMANAADPQQAMAIAQRISQQPQFQSPLFQGAIADVLKTMPEDPAQFSNWQEDTLRKTIAAKDRLERDYMQQNLGTSTRVISAPKYGGGGAEVLEGSEATVNIKPTVVNVEGLGPVIVDPNTGKGYPAGAGATGGYTPPGPSAPGLVGGERGGAAAALQTNPGAIKDGAFARSQPGYTGSSGGFAVFDTPEAGIRAQENLLRSAYIGKGFNTIDKIVNRYAPQGPENSAASVTNYKKYIADRTGIDINAPISAAQVPAVAAAMREFETGNRPGGKPGGRAGGAPQTVEQAASAQEKQRKVKTFQDLTGVNLESGEDPITPLIKGSTSGRIEAFGAELLGAIPEQFGGGATEGMKNIGKLETLASTLTLAFAPGGRLSTGVSNEDRAKIEQQLGKIEDPNIPAGKRLAAWQEVKAIMARTIGITPKSAAPNTTNRPKPSPADVAGVRRNRNNPDWTEGFRRQFGDEALRKALGGR